MSAPNELTQTAQRALGDKLYEKRKLGALEVERLVRSMLVGNQSGEDGIVVSSSTARLDTLCAFLIDSFAQHENANKRKGGLLGLAALLVGVARVTPVSGDDGVSPGGTEGDGGSEITNRILNRAVPEILTAFKDCDPRVRYYACESMYNVVKTFRLPLLLMSLTMSDESSSTDSSLFLTDNSALTTDASASVLLHIFDNLCDLSADADADVQNAAHLLDRLTKDVVSEVGADDGKDGTADSVDGVTLTELLGAAISKRLAGDEGTDGNGRADPYRRQFLLGWIAAIDQMPEIDALSVLPRFFHGVMQMLSDPNREIRQQADGALRTFLVEIKQELVGVGDGKENGTSASVCDLASLSQTLEVHTRARDEFTRVTAVTWLREFVQIAGKSVHAASVGGSEYAALGGSDDASRTGRNTSNQPLAAISRLPEITKAVLPCLSHTETKVRDVASRASEELLAAALTAAVSGTLHFQDLLSALAECAGPNEVFRGHDSRELLDTEIANDTGESRSVKRIHNPPNNPPKTQHTATQAEALRWYLALLETAPAKARRLILGRGDETEETTHPQPTIKTTTKTKSKPSSSFHAVLWNLSSHDDVVTKRALQVLARLGRSECDFEVVARALVGAFFRDEARFALEETTKTEKAEKAVATGQVPDDTNVPTPSFLRTRGSNTIRALCLSLGDAFVVKRLAAIVGEFFENENSDDCDSRRFRLVFAQRFTDVLNAIVLTSIECGGLRKALRSTTPDHDARQQETELGGTSVGTSSSEATPTKDALFRGLFPCWCHSPSATVGLCLLAGFDTLAVFALREMGRDEDELTLETLIRLDQLVHVLETPVFATLRLDCCGGQPGSRPMARTALFSILALLPQSRAWRVLSERLKSCGWVTHGGFFSQNGVASEYHEEVPSTLDRGMADAFRNARAAHRLARRGTRNET